MRGTGGMRGSGGACTIAGCIDEWNNGGNSVLQNSVLQNPENFVVLI